MLLPVAALITRAMAIRLVPSIPVREESDCVREAVGTGITSRDNLHTHFVRLLQTRGVLSVRSPFQWWTGDEFVGEGARFYRVALDHRTTHGNQYSPDEKPGGLKKNFMQGLH